MSFVFGSINVIMLYIGEILKHKLPFGISSRALEKCVPDYQVDQFKKGSA